MREQLGVRNCTSAHSVLGFDGTLQVRDPGGETLNASDQSALVAVGRKPGTQGWNLEALNLGMNGSAIKIDQPLPIPACATSTPSVIESGEPLSLTAPWRRARWLRRVDPKTATNSSPTAIAAVFTDRNWWWSADAGRG